jgi:hypothetical protein
MTRLSDGVTLYEIKAEVHRLDDTLEESDFSFMAAVCLMSSLVVGTKAVTIAAFTGYPLALVRDFSARLRASNVWTPEGKIRADWFDKETGIIAFWCDVNVARGYLSRVKRPRTRRPHAKT